MGGDPDATPRSDEERRPPEHSRLVEVLVTAIALLTGLSLLLLAGVPETPADGSGDFALVAIGLTGAAAIVGAGLVRRWHEARPRVARRLPEPYRDPEAPVYYREAEAPVCEQPDEVTV